MATPPPAPGANGPFRTAAEKSLSNTRCRSVALTGGIAGSNVRASVPTACRLAVAFSAKGQTKPDTPFSATTARLSAVTTAASFASRIVCARTGSGAEHEHVAMVGKHRLPAQHRKDADDQHRRRDQEMLALQANISRA